MLSKELKELYDGYYTDSNSDKRNISARDSIREILKVAKGRKFRHLLDVGAGEGAVLREIESSRLAEAISAVEISRSGIAAIKERNIATIREIKQFDGYNIPYSDKEFDIAVATYVLEHVQHERLFLAEMGRVAERIIVAVPLEHTVRFRSSRAESKKIGHINFYTPDTFRSLLETSGFEVERLFPYATSLEYERFLSPKTGFLKYSIRRVLLASSPRLACNVLTYMAIALCKSPST